MHINWLNVWTGGSAVLLVALYVAAVLLALVWALAGMLGLAFPLAVILYAIAAAASLMATVKFARMAHSAEPFFEEISRSKAGRTVTSGEEDR